MMGTDVGGIYRSLDGGQNWQVCMSGWLARGGDAFAIDPRDPKRVLGLAGNSVDWSPQWGPSPDGLYLSTDEGAHWRQVLPQLEANEDRPDSLAWDPASYDAKRGFCTVAYFESRDGGLFKSRDGGVTWSLVNAHSGAALQVHPTRGFVYLADNSKNGHGFYKSTDGGRAFRQINANYTLDLDVIPTRPNNVYISRWDKILVSTDAGETFHPVGANTGLPNNTPIRTIRVSPANPQEMLCNYGGAQWWQSFSEYSNNGGAAWQPPDYDTTNLFLPSNNGVNDVMMGGSFGFNPASPKTVFVSFQDFNGAVTQDGGKTWTYCNPSGQGWGGFGYGGFALNAHVLWTGDAPSWTGPRTLKVSRDGGKTWVVMHDSAGKPIVFAGPDVSNVDTGKPGVCFASNWRSDDSGQSWHAMTDCEAVFAASGTGALIGKDRNRVCRSLDHGITWTDITPDVPGGLSDISFDPTRRRLYVASENHVKDYNLSQGLTGTWRTLATPKDSRGNTFVASVCVDPADPSVVYAAGPANIYATDMAVVRSTDAGRTWVNLTVTAPLRSAMEPGGPHEVGWVRVDPATRELWAAGECFGLWRLPPPTSPSSGHDTHTAKLSISRVHKERNAPACG
jgi:hypothetical protein